MKACWGMGNGGVAFGGRVDRCLDDSSRPITRRTRFRFNQKGNCVATIKFEIEKVTRIVANIVTAWI